MQQKTKPEPKCIICNKPVDIMIDSYLKTGWKHNKCKFPDMIPSILNDSKKQEQSSLEKGKEKILRINWIDRRQPLTKHIVEWIYDESVKEALAEQKGL